MSRAFNFVAQHKCRVRHMRNNKIESRRKYCQNIEDVKRLSSGTLRSAAFDCSRRHFMVNDRYSRSTYYKYSPTLLHRWCYIIIHYIVIKDWYNDDKIWSIDKEEELDNLSINEFLIIRTI